jgi:hypothetical protein
MIFLELCITVTVRLGSLLRNLDHEAKSTTSKPDTAAKSGQHEDMIRLT